MIPARDKEEFELLPAKDLDFITQWGACSVKRFAVEKR